MIDAVLCQINGSYDIYLPPHRADRPEWYRPEGWEKKRLESMAEHITPLSVVYDIGAEEGDMSALYAMWGAEVVLIEPNPRVWPNIKFIWQANFLPKPLGCWAGFVGAPDQSRAGSADWPGRWLDNGWPRCAAGPLISDHGFLNLHERPDCPSITLDTLAASVRRPPTVLTMDVEGAEYEVLRGCYEVLANDKPWVWVSLHRETMQMIYGYEADVLFRYMDTMGYTAELIDPAVHEEHWLFRPGR